jgi:hypothetical protein
MITESEDTMIRRAIGLTLGDLAYDRNLFGVASFCYYRIAGYPRRIKAVR